MQISLIVEVGLPFFFFNTSSFWSCLYLWVTLMHNRNAVWGTRAGTTTTHCKWIRYILDVICSVQLHGICNVLNWGNILTLVCHLVLSFCWSSTQGCKCSVPAWSWFPFLWPVLSLKNMARGGWNQAGLCLIVFWICVNSLNASS